MLFGGKSRKENLAECGRKRSLSSQLDSLVSYSLCNLSGSCVCFPLKLDFKRTLSLDREIKFSVLCIWKKGFYFLADEKKTHLNLPTVEDHHSLTRKLDFSSEM